MLEFKPNEMHVCAMCITDVGVGLALEVTGVLPNAVGHHFFPLFYFPIFLCEDGMSSCNLVAPRAGVVVAFHSGSWDGCRLWQRRCKGDCAAVVRQAVALTLPGDTSVSGWSGPDGQYIRTCSLIML